MASRGAPESKSVTSASNPFGPAVPGETTSATFIVVAKSLPRSVTRGGLGAGGVTGGRGDRPVNVPVSPKTPNAPTSSIAMTRRRSPVLRAHPRDRAVPVDAPPARSTQTTTATLMSSVVSYELRNRCSSEERPPTSSVARSTPVTRTTASAYPARDE